jgi:hypothetical protein
VALHNWHSKDQLRKFDTHVFDTLIYLTKKVNEKKGKKKSMKKTKYQVNQSVNDVDVNFTKFIFRVLIVQSHLFRVSKIQISRMY